MQNVNTVFASIDTQILRIDVVVILSLYKFESLKLM
jgi:hypothetical protein